MKTKVFFLFILAILSSCSPKTYDSEYYRSKVSEAEEKQRLLEEKRKAKLAREKQISHDTGNPKDPYEISDKDKQKIAALVGTHKDSLSNKKLYYHINQWLGTPYLWGGMTKNGIDCSAFVQVLYREVYGMELPRTSVEMFHYDKTNQFQKKEYLQEGDLIFFRLRHKERVISHVGLYLGNGKFVGSNSPRGVEIVNLNTNYWNDKYVACGRLPISNSVR